MLGDHVGPTCSDDRFILPISSIRGKARRNRIKQTQFCKTSPIFQMNFLYLSTDRQLKTRPLCYVGLDTEHLTTDRSCQQVYSSVFR